MLCNHPDQGRFNKANMRGASAERKRIPMNG
jgi:hypothetical protein